MGKNPKGVITRRVDYNTRLGKYIDMDTITRHLRFIVLTLAAGDDSNSYLCYFFPIFLLSKLYSTWSKHVPSGLRFDSIRSLVATGGGGLGESFIFFLGI